MSKITKQEFENYNKGFLPIFVRMMGTSEFKSESQEKKKKKINSYYHYWREY